MRYTLEIAAMPAGYGEAVLPIAAAKAHLGVLEDDDDDLIGALRDAAVMMVETYTGLILNPRDGDDALVWRAEGLPNGYRCSPSVSLGVRPIRSIVSVAYLDSAGDAQAVDVDTLRISGDGCIVPKAGAAWPSATGGGVVVTFAAGLDEAPPMLVTAAKMFLATLYMQRESIVTSGATGEVTHGFKMLCQPYRRILV